MVVQVSPFWHPPQEGQQQRGLAANRIHVSCGALLRCELRLAKTRGRHQQQYTQAQPGYPERTQEYEHGNILPTKRHCNAWESSVRISHRGKPAEMLRRMIPASTIVSTRFAQQSC